MRAGCVESQETHYEMIRLIWLQIKRGDGSKAGGGGQKEGRSQRIAHEFLEFDLLPSASDQRESAQKEEVTAEMLRV